MCILFFLANPDPPTDGYRLILVNNRDEYFIRPAKPAHYWKDNANIIGGMDLEPGKEGGTWLAMSMVGKIAVLLNVLQPVGVSNKTKKGRGFLVPDFLASNDDGLEFLNKIHKESHSYNTFNMVTIDISKNSFTDFDICHYSNLTSDHPSSLISGVYGFGNSPPETPWRKVVYGEKKFTEIIDNHPTTDTMTQLIEELIQLLNDETNFYPDPQLQQQGQGRSADILSSLSSLFVKIPSINYGTRTNTIILVDSSNQVTFIERTMKEPIDPKDPTWMTTEYCFNLQQQQSH